MLTIENAEVSVFPFNLGDTVEIHWSCPTGLIEKGTIDALHTGIQWGREVVYAIMVKVDGADKPCVVGFDCIKK